MAQTYRSQEAKNNRIALVTQRVAGAMFLVAQSQRQLSRVVLTGETGALLPPATTCAVHEFARHLRGREQKRRGAHGGTSVRFAPEHRHTSESPRAKAHHPTPPNKPPSGLGRVLKNTCEEKRSAKTRNAHRKNTSHMLVHTRRMCPCSCASSLSTARRPPCPDPPNHRNSQ